jgi:hypothetical protein
MLSGLLGTILSKVVMTLVGALIGWVAKVLHVQAQDRAADKAAVDEHKPLKDAQTAQEIDDASDSALNRL